MMVNRLPQEECPNCHVIGRVYVNVEDGTKLCFECWNYNGDDDE